MNTETKHTPDELITCPACGNEYQYQDSPQCFESAEATAKKIARLKADKAELIESLKDINRELENTLQSEYATRSNPEPEKRDKNCIKARAIIAKHSK